MKNGGWGVFICLAATGKGVNHELLCLAGLGLVKCETLCLTAKAWLKLDKETGKPSQVPANPGLRR